MISLRAGSLHAGSRRAFRVGWGRVARARWRRAARVGWCVRLDWADGTHHLVAQRWSRGAARRAAAGLERYWARGPVAPVSCVVVPVSRHDWRLHRFRPDCRAPDCPTSTNIDAHALDFVRGVRTDRKGQP